MGKRKTHCWRGHAFTEKNTQWSVQRKGYSTYIVQRCKRCEAEQKQRKYYGDPVYRAEKIAAATRRYYEMKDEQGTSLPPQ